MDGEGDRRGGMRVARVDDEPFERRADRTEQHRHQKHSGGHSARRVVDRKTYRFEAKMVDKNTVKIRGYMGIPLLGQSQIWKRVQSAG